MLEQGPSKGGVGGEPKGPRPPAPAGQGGTSNEIDAMALTAIGISLEGLCDCIKNDREKMALLEGRIEAIEKMFYRGVSDKLTAKMIDALEGKVEP